MTMTQDEHDKHYAKSVKYDPIIGDLSKDKTFFIISGYTYLYSLLFTGLGGEYQKKEKVYKMPSACFDDIERLIVLEKETQKEHTFEVWKEACDILDYDFVRKGTPEYDEVRKLFLKMIRKNKK
jgi:hypothetical protein